MSQAAEEIAAVLLETGAFLVRPEAPFRLTSGLYAPFYVNCRLILSRPEARAQGRRRRWRRPCRSRAPRSIAGGVTAGVPFATLVADRLALPMVYVRAEAKAHGTAGRIEGGDVAGERVHLIEDLISTAGSILAFTRRRCAMRARRSSGVSVLFSRAGASAQEALEEAGLALTAICDLDTLLSGGARQWAYRRAGRLAKSAPSSLTREGWSAQPRRRSASRSENRWRGPCVPNRRSGWAPAPPGRPTSGTGSPCGLPGTVARC